MVVQIPVLKLPRFLHIFKPLRHKSRLNEPKRIGTLIFSKELHFAEKSINMLFCDLSDSGHRAHMMYRTSQIFSVLLIHL
jgi:hypothetical protein